MVSDYTRDFKIGRARSASSIRNQKYDLRLKLHDMKFNYHFITAILKSQNSVNSVSTNNLLIKLLVVKKPKQKGFYISFCIRNRNDAI